MIEITSFPNSIGAKISDRGNPVILGVDEASGIVVGIEVNSANWKDVLKKLGQLGGIGIIPANQLPRAMGKPNGDLAG
jgi:hypothetical protein